MNCCVCFPINQPWSFSDLPSIPVPLDLGLLLGQLARELRIIELGDGLVFELCAEVGRRLADDQLGGGLVVPGDHRVLALVGQRAVLDGERVLFFVDPVDDAFAEGDLLAGLHPLHSGVGSVGLAGEADGLLLLSVDVLRRNHDLQTLLWKTHSLQLLIPV